MPTLLIHHLWIEQEAWDLPEPEEIVLSVGDFVTWAMDECFLNEGEFPDEALGSYSADYYGCQISNGGHKQFVRNSDWRDEAIRFTELGLRMMRAAEELSAFQKLKSIMADPAIAKELLEGPAYGDEPEEIEGLDDLVSYDILRVKNAAWLRSLTNTKLMPLADLQIQKREFKKKMAFRIAAVLKSAGED